ncbi:hypothetical protein RchiOBHm_Chr2g0089071 [Rosa chinensis]|uniref:Uncharacterized protein n=1 Tax=Rosa chinensis TaxID=74649 RepID=A0A2P6RJ44_ROSCH|nr:hypothetical protein RchiOBHm_Chr2g0089071 [Rosa chinensis]
MEKEHKQVLHFVFGKQLNGNFISIRLDVYHLVLLDVTRQVIMAFIFKPLLH